MVLKDEREVSAMYNSVGKHYHYDRTKRYPDGWFYNELVEMPAMLDMLGRVNNKKVLDFGCGSGIYAKLLTKKGAKVSGFDISKTMLSIAKKENPKLDLRLGSGYKIPFTEEFDIVQASLVLDYLKDWDKVFKEVYRVLKPNGIFVFSIPNPVVNGSTGVKIDENRYKIVHDYFKEELFYETWGIDKGPRGNIEQIKVPNYHKTYETIIKTILRNGFEIIDYKDAVPIEKAKKLFPGRYYAYHKIPTFCVWKVSKKSNKA